MATDVDMNENSRDPRIAVDIRTGDQGTQGTTGTDAPTDNALKTK